MPCFGENMEIKKELVGDLSKKVRHDERRARQKAKRHKENLGLLPIRWGDVKNPVPHISTAGIATKGEYLELGKGFIMPWNTLREILKRRKQWKTMDD